MKVDLRDLIAALPPDLSEELETEAESSHEQLQRIFADLARRPVPVGSLERMWTVGELSIQITLAYLAYWIRGWFADAGARKKQLIETNLRVALKTIHKLGYLRGAATKLGQALGNLPDILPDQIVSTLDMLHSEAPPMHFSLLREMVHNEVGADPEDLFENFEKDAFAAVKIQYPGIARTIDDLLSGFHFRWAGSPISPEEGPILKRYTQTDPLFIYWNRSVLGFRSLMYQMRAQVDMNTIFKREKAAAS